MKREDFNRKMYDRVRKMDRCQMQVFFNQVFDSGYAAGVKDMSEEMQVPELIGLEEKLQEIRGIGGAKARAISETVKKFFVGKGTGADENSSAVPRE